MTIKQRLEQWKIVTPETPGLHECVLPGVQDCREVNILRLNLQRNESRTVDTGGREMNFVLIYGAAHVKCNHFTRDMTRLDSFYLPGQETVTLTALEDCSFYIGAAVWEGYGRPFYRKFDLSLPLGEIHQIHGRGAGRREVFFTLDPQSEASRLLCGLTWGGNGSWTSWPPHQHEKDLEEAYCYFDMDTPRFGLHLSYLKSGKVEETVVHVVRSGVIVLAPMGYHPTVASPGSSNTYLWVLAAHSHASRRYDLAVPDPVYEDT